MTCPFCCASELDVEVSSDVGMIVRDAYPSAQGHRLVIPSRHVSSVFELSDDDQRALWDLVAEARCRLIAEVRPAGVNVGINDGAAAGQTVGHGHIHVIPRHEGDVEDPRGGVRWVLPGTARYWDD